MLPPGIAGSKQEFRRTAAFNCNDGVFSSSARIFRRKKGLTFCRLGDVSRSRRRRRAGIRSPSSQVPLWLRCEGWYKMVPEKEKPGTVAGALR